MACLQRTAWSWLGPSRAGRSLPASLPVCTIPPYQSGGCGPSHIREAVPTVPDWQQVTESQRDSHTEGLNLGLSPDANIFPLNITNLPEKSSTAFLGLQTTEEREAWLRERC